MRRFISLRCRISSLSEKRCCASFSYTSSTFLRNPSILSRNGLSNSSSDSRFVCLNWLLFSSSISAARFLNSTRCRSCRACQLLFLACRRLVARREFLRQGSLAYRRFGQLHRLPGELVTQRPDLLFTLSRLLPPCFAFEREPPQNRTVSQHRPGRPYEQPYQYPQYRHMISVQSAAQLPIPFTKIVNFADF